MGSKLPEDLKWSEAAATLLAETEKKSVKAVSTTISKACAEKDKKVSAMAAVVDLATWAKEAGAFWPEPYLVALMPNVLALCADKQKDVQVKAEEVTTASASPAYSLPIRPGASYPDHSPCIARPALPLTLTPQLSRPAPPS